MLFIVNSYQMSTQSSCPATWDHQICNGGPQLCPGQKTTLFLCEAVYLFILFRMLL